MTDEALPAQDAMARKMAAENRRVRTDYPAFADAYDRLVARLEAGKSGADAPRTGDILPPFALPADDGRLVGLSDFGNAKSIVISLNRGHWCTYCRVELESMRDIDAEIERRGGALVAITPDRERYVRKLKEELGLPFPLLSDVDNAYALSLGLVVWCGDEVQALYRSINWNLDRFQGSDGWFVPIPATYVVSPDGRIKASFVEPDFRRRIEPAAILDAI